MLKNELYLPEPQVTEETEEVEEETEEIEEDPEEINMGPGWHIITVCVQYILLDLVPLRH